MLLTLAAFAATPNLAFSAAMNQYLACMSAGVPADIAARDLATRSQVYRAAAARCRGEREAAIAAAVQGRQPGTSEAQARSLAIDIIDTLDPLSSMRKH
jgi:hypothetical protein